MLFQKKLEKALEKLHEKAGTQEEKDMPDLEKNDFLAMHIAAFITIIPIAIIVLVVISVIGYFFLMH